VNKIGFCYCKVCLSLCPDNGDGECIHAAAAAERDDEKKRKNSPYWAAAEYFMRTRASAGDDFDLWHLLFVNVTFLDLCPADFSLQIHSDVPFIFYTLLTFA
jgi:hypothetical protein